MWLYILVIVFFALSLVNTKIFLYQRTVRKFAMNFNLSQDSLVYLYPKSYLIGFNLSRLRWILLIVIVILNWKWAAILFVVCFLLKMILPVNDIKHLKVMLSLAEGEHKRMIESLLLELEK